MTTAARSSGLPAGYTYTPEDGLWRRPVEFATGGRLYEVLVRNGRGQLVRVERGRAARRFFLCAR